ncbi:hypothetical protein KBD20_02815 [Candidatus Saccharibacteria bacterium]|nr:hypothetical protein [Candidatus Saccharibacteria bacterium]
MINVTQVKSFIKRRRVPLLFAVVAILLVTLVGIAALANSNPTNKVSGKTSAEVSESATVGTKKSAVTNSTTANSDAKSPTIPTKTAGKSMSGASNSASNQSSPTQTTTQSVSWSGITPNIDVLSGGECLYTFTSTAHIAKAISSSSEILFFNLIIQALTGPDTSGENPTYLDTTPSLWDNGQPKGDVQVTSSDTHPIYGAMILYPAETYKVTYWANNQLSPSAQNWYSSPKTFTVPSGCTY